MARVHEYTVLIAVVAMDGSYGPPEFRRRGWKNVNHWRLFTPFFTTHILCKSPTLFGHFCDHVSNPRKVVVKLLQHPSNCLCFLFTRSNLIKSCTNTIDEETNLKKITHVQSLCIIILMQEKTKFIHKCKQMI